MACKIYIAYAVEVEAVTEHELPCVEGANLAGVDGTLEGQAELEGELECNDE